MIVPSTTETETPQHWTAERIYDEAAKVDRWAMFYDPTPVGRRTIDGTTIYAMRFPVCFISEWFETPEAVAIELCAALNARKASPGQNGGSK